MKHELPAAQLLGQLSLRDKLKLLAGRSLFSTRPVAALSLPSMKLVDGPRGVGWHSSLRRCTAFPTGIALGASWDPELAEAFGRALASEVRAVGGHVLLGPAVNICRTPLNGRTFEYFTEDPHLNSRLAVPTIRGIQSQGVAACVKHFAVNNQEKYRARISAQVSERALREIYLPVFEAAVREADVWSVMAAYNAVNGEAACDNTDLLQHRLREEYGFQGFVVSDWFAARRTRSTETCLRAGLNLEMPGKGSKYRYRRLRKAIEAGTVPEKAVDRALEPLLRIWRRVTDSSLAGGGQRNTVEHQRLAYRMAADSITLLKNADGVLPLSNAVRSVAVLGPRARRRNCRPLYGGSAGVWSPYEITPLQGLRERLPESCEIVSDPANAETAIIFVGLGHRLGGDFEGRDRPHMRLPREQEQLIRDTAVACSRTVVVLVSGSPLEMSWADEVDAIVAAWYPGMEGGRAIADMLLGDINPSGKLPVSFPLRLSDCPAHASERRYPGEGGTVFYEEGVFVGYRHYDYADLDVLFPFGHGLSYTDFVFRDPQLPSRWSAGRSIEITVTLQNVGDRAGAEVAQLYVGAVASPVERPRRELKAFRKVFLQPGESQTLTFTLDERALAYWCEQTDQWRSDPGQYNIYLGHSSRNLAICQQLSYG